MTTPVTVKVKRLPAGAGLPLPAAQTMGSAGFDLMAAVAADLTLAPGAYLLVPTGIALELPPGFEAQIRPRSGLAMKHGVTVLNAPGTIDADYRGEVGVILVNAGTQPFEITWGLRIAQLVVAEALPVTWEETDALSETDRGAGGFGSTGLEAAQEKETASC